MFGEEGCGIIDQERGNIMGKRSAQATRAFERGGYVRIVNPRDLDSGITGHKANESQGLLGGAPDAEPAPH